ncbi:AraC family transcriptional regulator [Photobacterium jeanii]|uniref:AraC family transcriptional regulator n=1 Tax=Photobacterium jeanii TaxID=858640 RepID=A0A178KNB6_9GAMM|nr:AraC family transcriptional regulator [Photobacterium jeanii]OAN18163.1 AraC family transcriptional regulator [Photobacterium jeanii]PST92161.1 AraC family transcriptional regulator [Photobacterium jeanii]
MKGNLEKVPQRIGASWRYRKIVEEKKSYGWHRHKEYEIAIHRHFSGSCFIGHSQNDVSHNHMVLIGPDLPHAIYSNDSSSQQKSTSCETHVIWFRQDWIEQLINCCHELAPLKKLLSEAKYGIQFSSHTAEKAVALLEPVLDLPPHQQLTQFLSMLALLLEDKNAQKLINALEPAPEDEVIVERIEKAEAFLMKHFAREIAVQELANHLYISESSVRRLFQKHYNESFSQHLKKIRLNVACDLLINTQLPINIIIQRVGYDNQANFNRQFKAYKQVTPSAFRTAMKRH